MTSHGPPARENILPQLSDQILGVVPRLRAFAIALTRNADEADDLVQEAVVRGLKHQQRFTPGTNLEAWLFTILRNHHYGGFRRKRREVQDADGAFAQMIPVPPEQEGVVDLGDLHKAMAQLPPKQRQVLLLVGQGYSYHEAAHSLRVEVGTIKSRVHRARRSLAEALSHERLH